MKFEEQLAQYEPKKVLAAGFVAAVIWYILPLDNIADLKSAQSGIQSQIQQVQAELEDVRLATANNELFEEQVRETSKIYKEILGYFPVDFSTPDFMIALTGQMKEAGGRRINVQPMSKVTVSEIYDRHPFSVELEATYPAIMQLLSGLTQMSQITTVKSMKMSAISADSRRSMLKFEAVISGYSYNGNLGVEGNDLPPPSEPTEEVL